MAAPLRWSSSQTSSNARVFAAPAMWRENRLPERQCENLGNPRKCRGFGHALHLRYGETRRNNCSGQAVESEVAEGKALKKEPANTHLPAKPAVTASPGPGGYKTDCATMTPGQLHAAYHEEYQSGKDSKSRSEKKDWVFASEWDNFKDFLASMGPKPSLAHTLVRRAAPPRRTRLVSPLRWRCARLAPSRRARRRHAMPR